MCQQASLPRDEETAIGLIIGWSHLSIDNPHNLIATVA